MKKVNKKRIILVVILLVLLSAVSVFTFTIESEKREVKEDLVELSNVKYGLFNVDEWKNIVASIIIKKMDEFDFDPMSRRQMKKKITKFLYEIVNDLENRYYQENKSSISGFFKNEITSLTGTFDKIKKDIPIFSNQIVDFIDNPKKSKTIKNYLMNKLGEYAKNTFELMDYTYRDAILEKYGCDELKSAITHLNRKVFDLQRKSEYCKGFILITGLILVLLMLVSTEWSSLELILVSCICIVYLTMGLIFPMIEIDARISEVKFSLLGEKISFTDQILYYRSKSILEVTRLMLFQRKIDLFFVGILVLLFSVLFPVFKLISTALYLISERSRNNKIIHFLVFKIGKWSMADVMVVAIFMAFLGFSGILSDQLTQLDSVGKNLELLTTNNSGLQIGFYAFTLFTVLSLLVSDKLKKSPLSMT